MGTRAVRVLLWLLLLAAPVLTAGLSVQVAALAGQLEQVQAEPESSGIPDTGAEGAAQVAVAQFLAERDAGPALWVVSLGSAEIAPGYFAVTVAAATTSTSGGAISVAYYTVGVAGSNPDWTVVGRPSLVAAPKLKEQPETAVARMNGLADVAGMEEAVAGFAAAYLLGDGDLTRYTAPGVDLTHVEPSPFVSIEIVASGSVPRSERTRLVGVFVEGTYPDGSVLIFDYWLEMGLRDGRWEVLDLLPAAPLTENS